MSKSETRRNRNRNKNKAAATNANDEMKEILGEAETEKKEVPEQNQQARGETTVFQHVDELPFVVEGEQGPEVEVEAGDKVGVVDAEGNVTEGTVVEGEGGEVNVVDAEGTVLASSTVEEDEDKEPEVTLVACPAHGGEWPLVTRNGSAAPDCPQCHIEAEAFMAQKKLEMENPEATLKVAELLGAKARLVRVEENGTIIADSGVEEPCEKHPGEFKQFHINNGSVSKFCDVCVQETVNEAKFVEPEPIKGPGDLPEPPKQEPVAEAPKETQEQRRARKRTEALENARKVPWKLLEEYVVIMNPRRPTKDDELISQQAKLANQFINLIAGEEDEAVAIENIRRLLDIIREHRGQGGCFNDVSAMRRVNDTVKKGLSKERVLEFQSLYYALLTMADKGKKTIMDWEVFGMNLANSRAERIISRLRRAVNIRAD
ncbi:hypothetical protein [Vibrio phage vB_VmeM-Yong XC32]|nr:hypothetical protein [Vibrio phage vB_VmeM-Yong XC31]QAX96341.1 hypothetical protein [Vibrio phage vB_VmeM-Yong XC32]QAX96659.1 hypothetical protein [Vibrio phage vB_VmeM-Yong MS31]QAX96977.1 hypothetical protein [Vibrio phage vB_VmeM-Yong MS32]